MTSRETSDESNDLDRRPRLYSLKHVRREFAELYYDIRNGIGDPKIHEIAARVLNMLKGSIEGASWEDEIAQLRAELEAIRAERTQAAAGNTPRASGYTESRLAN